MRVLIACECSGVVREAFAARGHDVWSCDLQETEIPGNHIRGDVFQVLNDGWDLMIGFPPCTYLTYAGARWFNQPGRAQQQLEAIDFFMGLVSAPIEKIAIENPRGVMARVYRKPDDCIQPYYFGHTERKRTYLWLKGLPGLMASLVSADPVNGWVTSVHGSKTRSRTFYGVAQAMAKQWG